MSDRDAIAAKLDVFLELLDELMGDAVAAGVPEIALRRTLMARATMLFKSPEAAPDGIATLDHFRRVLERELVPSAWPIAGQ